MFAFDFRFASRNKLVVPNQLMSNDLKILKHATVLKVTLDNVTFMMSIPWRESSLK